MCCYLNFPYHSIFTLWWLLLKEKIKDQTFRKSLNKTLKIKLCDIVRDDTKKQHPNHTVKCKLWYLYDLIDKTIQETSKQFEKKIKDKDEMIVKWQKSYDDMEEEKEKLEQKIKKLERKDEELLEEYTNLEFDMEMNGENSFDEIKQLKKQLKDQEKSYKKIANGCVKDFNESLRRLDKQLKDQPKQIFDDIEKCIHTDELSRQTCEYDTEKYEELKKKWLK